MEKLKLNTLNSSILKEHEMENIKGGKFMLTYTCACACAYAKLGGSSTKGNGGANISNNLCSPGMKCLNNMSMEELCNINLRQLQE